MNPQWREEPITLNEQWKDGGKGAGMLEDVLS